jgi:hypothetical protein
MLLAGEPAEGRKKEFTERPALVSRRQKRHNLCNRKAGTGFPV